MKPYIFREYDIRGIVPEELNEQTVHQLGLAIGTYYVQKGVKKITLGRDCRLSSPSLFEGLSAGLLETGMDIVDVGMVPTPLLYFSIHHLKVDGGVQITGSHNPPEFNGFKVCLGEASIYGPEIQKVREIAESGSFTKGTGNMEKADVVTPYITYVTETIQTGNHKRKVVIDAGNGVAGPVATPLYKGMGFEVISLFAEPDGRFPNHHPDPTIPDNLKSLISKVQETGADVGIGFDGDADRIGVVDKDGRIIWGDQLMIIFSRDLLERYPGAKIIGEVKCSQVLYDDIEKHGGKAIMWKTGHSLIKKKMKEEGALLAGEMSGHLFFAERYFGYDDAIYAGARLLEILSKTDKGVRDLLAGVPDMVNTPEIRIDCPEEKKFTIVAELAEEFKRDYKVIDVDGARVLFDGGWGLIRASNTQPVLVLRFEAETESRLEEIRKVFMDKLQKRL
ncbi:MAG: phosphomannomutase/phosphoglucomutase [Deltaproteobacteria bacterium]|nr:phosphomannomutase/phosphoglucomutase [Deltaproteobacteria bacterium]MBW1928841.1 phosphomannomutase/phosphoglucomutase [Deltaproteobacteria bacterium]MBW2026667.1 phosphomannomutase/phosphoglucomutase [Deltaproteobacteria bacterium]RLB20827.1 MAG: phosphomannomutase [Deltaproteobacteria bacterium]